MRSIVFDYHEFVDTSLSVMFGVQTFYTASMENVSILFSGVCDYKTINPKVSTFSCVDFMNSVAFGNVCRKSFQVVQHFPM